MRHTTRFTVDNQHLFNVGVLYGFEENTFAYHPGSACNDCSD
jgi:hypothetical protein